jgi:hypothetical protein
MSKLEQIGSGRRGMRKEERRGKGEWKRERKGREEEEGGEGKGGE